MSNRAWERFELVLQPTDFCHLVQLFFHAPHLSKRWLSRFGRCLDMKCKTLSLSQSAPVLQLRYVGHLSNFYRACIEVITKTKLKGTKTVLENRKPVEPHASASSSHISIAA